MQDVKQTAQPNSHANIWFIYLSIPVYIIKQDNQTFGRLVYNSEP